MKLQLNQSWSRCLLLIMFVGFCLPASALRIEEAQRALQERYQIALHQSLSWPDNLAGMHAPDFPDDGFYEQDMADPSRAAALVSDIAGKLNNDNLLNRFVAGDIDGQTTISTYNTTRLPPVTNITSENYANAFSILTGYICKLQNLYTGASQVGPPDGKSYITVFLYSLFPGEPFISLQQRAYTTWNFYNQSGWSLNPGSDPIGSYVFVSGYSNISYWNVNTRSIRGRIHADLRSFTGVDGAPLNGNAQVYLKVVPRPDGVGEPQPPANADSTYQAFQSAVLGQVWTSSMIGDQRPVIENPGAGTPATKIKGWSVTEQVVLITPAYQHQIEECAPTDCACSEGGTSCPAGSGNGVQTSTGSVRVQIDLGRADFGKSAGQLSIDQELPNAQISTPAVLKISARTGVHIISDTNGIRQVKTSQAIADVVVTNPFKYDIRFYTVANAGVTNSAGLYQPVGSPYSTISVENPDGTNSVNRVRVTETVESTSKVSDFEYFPADKRWDLTKGGGARNESRTKTWSGGVRTETFVIRDSSVQVVTKRVETFQIFPWGEEKIQQVDDPDGAALSTAWSFFSSQVQDGVNYGRLKSVVKPSGYWERYEYDQYGRNIKTVAQYLDAPFGSAESACRVTTTAYADTDPAVTVVETVLGQEISRRYVVHRPGERREIRCQTAGAAWDDPTNLVTVEKRNLGGQFEGELKNVKNPDSTMSFYEYSISAGQKTTTVSTGQPNASETAIVDGTRTTTVVDVPGNVILEQTDDIASSLQLSSALTTQTDDFGRPTRIEYNDGTFLTRAYGCCGLESETDREGVTTTFVYDDLKRLILQSRAGISSLYTYDADGRVLKTIRKGTDNSEITTEEAAYDVAGRRISLKDALNHTTTFTETIEGSGHTVKTMTDPNGGTRIEIFAKDGSLLEIAGTAVHPLKFEYGVEAAGQFTKEIRLGVGGSLTEWVKTTTDFLGRIYKTTFADGAIQQSFYNNKGQLIRQVDPDGVTTLLEYNEGGEQEVSVVDINRNGVVDYAGLDRITKTVSDVVEAHATTVRRATTSVWATDNADTPSVLSVQESSVDGLQSWNTTLGLTTHSQTVLNGSGGRVVTVTAPDSSTTVSQFQDGRLTSIVRNDALNNQVTATTYAYDPHGRQSTVTDARNGPTAFIYNDLDQPTSVTSGGQTTSYAYDVLGRRTQTTLPDAGTVTSEYFDTGELKKTFGVRTYTTEHTYDLQGRLKTLLAGTGTTTWHYTLERGFLGSKIYADGKGPNYTYTPAGRLASRLWARGLSTTYTYNNAGDLGVIDYSDATTDVAQNYDRLGRPANVSDAVGTRTLAYNLLSRVLSETYTGGPLGGTQIQRTYALNRLATLTASGNGYALPVVGYSYDAASRLENVSDGTHSAAYTYHPNSTLVSGVTFKTGATTKLTTAKSFDNLNRLTAITNTSANDTPRSFTYTYNNANQRTRVDLADGSYWIYTYDPLGQVTSGKKYFSDNTPVSGQQFDYSFDGIGNRVGTTTNGRNATYTSNNLNQYLERVVPGAFDVFGSAEADAIVTVNNQPTARHSDYFYKELTLNNAVQPVFEDISVVGVKNLVGPNDEDAVTQDMGKAYLPRTPEIFTYDDDGNLLADGRWNYTWDGENRLISMAALSSVPATGKKKLEFTYDHQGRRISKKVYSWNSGSSSYQLQDTRYCVYDGWNKIAELSSTGALLSSHVWGNDLSGSMQGAGGVGGLLFSTNHQLPVASYAFGYDGNGNVTSLTDMTTGTTGSEYEYSAFGETLKATGTATAANRFGFSTKYADAETGLGYYGYRYLNSGTGRWMSRDPIHELGGSNLYAAVANNLVNDYDMLGLINPLQLRVDRIEFYLSLGDNTLAAQEAHFLYINLTTGGQFPFPFATEMMEHWLGNTGTKKTLSASRVKNLVMDNEVSLNFGSAIAPTLTGFTGTTVFATNVTPALNTDNYYAVGTFQLKFDGTYCVKGDNIDLDGSWSVSDGYNWNNGESVTVRGVLIKDDYATLVENIGRAKPYDVDGSWKGKHSVSKTGGSGGGR